MPTAVWIEIPVKDFEQAYAFYSALYEEELKLFEEEVRTWAMFPRKEGEKTGISILKAEDFEPGSTGTLLYLSGGEDLSTMLDKVEPAGGTIVTPKTALGNLEGYYAIFADTEGNHVALYSPK